MSEQDRPQDQPREPSPGAPGPVEPTPPATSWTTPAVGDSPQGSSAAPGSGQSGYPPPGYPEVGSGSVGSPPGNYPQPGSGPGGYAPGGYPPPAYPPGGYPQPGYPDGGYRAAPRNGFGVTALVLGILALLAGLAGFLVITIPLAVVGGIIGIGFGIAGRRRATRGEATNGGMAITGLVLAAIGVVAGILWGVLLGTVLTRVAEQCNGLSGPQLQQCVQDNATNVG